VALRFDPSKSSLPLGIQTFRGQEIQGGGGQPLLEPDANIASPQVVLPKRSFLPQRIMETFGAFRTSVAAVMLGVLLVGGATTASAQVRNELPVARVVQAQDAFNAAHFTEYPLFKMFWEQPSTQAEGLTNHGEFELTAAGVEKLKAYALTHNMDGSSVAPRTEPSVHAKAFIAHLLAHPHYGAFIEQAARPELQRAFGLPVDTAAPLVGEVPVKAGDVTIPTRVSWNPQAMMRSWLVVNQPGNFEFEYNARKDFFEDPSASAEEKSRRVLGLYSDYVDAIRIHGQLFESETALEQLQSKLQATPFWSVLGNKDFNGAGWSVVESIGLGLDPNKFPTAFPNAGVDPKVNYFSMDGSLAKPMELVDKWRVAAGLEARASAYESKSVLGFLIGAESGHRKVGYFNEAKPFSTSGLNWGVLLFPGDAQIAALQPKSGFEFPIDAIDSFGVAFNNNPALGDYIKVYDSEKRELRVQREIHEEDGKPKYWSAKFFRPDGSEVAPDQVLGLILGAAHRVKGDGKAAASLDMGFWGFCNVNTAQGVFKPSYGIPQLDAREVRVRAPNGEIIEFPTEVAQKLLDADIEGLISKQAFAGFRFGRDPQTIRLTDGTTISGTVESYNHVAGRRTTRDSGDVITVSATPEAPFPGTIGLKNESGQIVRINPAQIVAIRELADGKVEIEQSSSYPPKVIGTLTRPISFAGSPVEEGARVYRPNAQQPLQPEMSIKLADGSTKMVLVSMVSSISGETQSDVRPSDFVSMVVLMNGVYATDASMGPSVSNGARHIKALETIVEHGAHRPDWAKTTAPGIYGPLVRQDGDKMLFRRGTYGPNESSPWTNFAVWHQLDASGRIINEGWITGEPDFLWGSIDKLNWNAKSIWNPHFSPELRLGLLVNGVKDMDTLEALASKLNLPENWREYRTRR
jgi:hypothetical protein